MGETRVGVPARPARSEVKSSSVALACMLYAKPVGLPSAQTLPVSLFQSHVSYAAAQMVAGAGNSLAAEAEAAATSAQDAIKAMRMADLSICAATSSNCWRIERDGKQER